MKLVIFCSVWLGLASVCLAGPPKKPVPASHPPLPDGPLLAAIPDNTHWVIVRSGVDAKKSKNPKAKQDAPFIEKIEGERTGQVRHVVTTSGNGGKVETWQNGNRMVTIREGWNAPLVTTKEADKADFETLDWISPDRFTGTEKVEGKDCLIFQARVFPSGGDQNLTKANLDGVDPETLKVSAEASIDATTRLPVRLQIGDEQTVYKFEPMRPATLEVPAEIRSTPDAGSDDQEKKSAKKSRDPQ